MVVTLGQQHNRVGGKTHRYTVHLDQSPCRDRHQQSIDKGHRELGLQLNLLHSVQDRMGVDEGNIEIFKSWMYLCMYVCMYSHHI